MPVTLLDSQDAFDAFVKANKLVAIDFFADWCGPCKAIGPRFVTFADKYPTVSFAKVNVDDADDVAVSCAISAMPTFQFYKDGAKVGEFKGANEGKLEEQIQTLAA